jgi:transposase
MRRVRADRALFPPEDVAVVKAAACERPQQPGRPLSRLSVNDVLEKARSRCVNISYSSVWRILDRDAIRPWYQRCWIFPRDPLFLERASPALELYSGHWQGQPLGPRDLVLCGDEMTGLQALSRIHPPLPCASARDTRFEFEYERHGTLVYIAFLDVFGGHVYGEAVPKNGIVPFEDCLEHCLQQPRYREIERTFLITDGGSAHHRSTAPARIRAKFPNVTVVPLPTHASWLNQVEIYFSIVHRKALHPADFPSVNALAERLLAFQEYYNKRAKPFRWRYTSKDLKLYLQKLAANEEILAHYAASHAKQEPLTLH